MHPRRTLLGLCLLAGGLACQRPEVEPRPIGERPLQVRLDYQGGEPGTAIDDCYGEALRDRLAHQVRVLPKQQLDATDSATLVVHLTFLDSRADVVGKAASEGFSAGFEAGWKGTGKSGNDPKSVIQDAAAGVVFGTLFGVVAAPVNAAAAETRAIYHNARLGYKPRHVVVQVSLIPLPEFKAVPLFETSAFEVVKAMRPMKNVEAREPGRLIKEEAYALAKVVSERLEGAFGWKPRPRTEPAFEDPPRS